MQTQESTDLNKIIIGQANVTFEEFVYYFLKTVLVVLIFLFILKRKKRDLKKQQIKQSSLVPIEKIVVALEIEDFFVTISSKREFGFEPFQEQTQKASFISKVLENILGLKMCYKIIYPHRQILNFVKNLKSVSKIELMLYTTLNAQLTELILKKLKITEFFPVQNRKYCNPKQHDTMKHAIDVDKESRRVVIITPNKRYHNWEDGRYFLIQNPKGGKNKNLLKDCFRHIKTLVEENQSLDTLHDELAQLKIDVEESDVSDFSDVQKEVG